MRTGSMEGCEDLHCNARVLERKRQLFLVDEALETQKEEFSRNMDAFRRREDALRKKDLRLQESLIKFNKFLQENESKKTRAMRRCADEARLCEATAREVLQLNNTLNTKKCEEKELSDVQKLNQKYQKYLKSVVEKVQGSSDDFSEIQDILDRFKTLKNTNDDLMTLIQLNTREHEARRLNYAQFMKKSGNEMLNMNNEIVGLQRELEQVTISSNKMESQDYGTCRNVNELTTDISQALLVIDNMAERLECCAHPSLQDSNMISSKTNEEDGIEDKVKKVFRRLEGIADRIIDYKNIADAWEINLI